MSHGNHEFADDNEQPVLFREIEDKRVCVDCLIDPGLKKFFRKRSGTQGVHTCSYCKKGTMTIEVKELQRYLVTYFTNRFDDAHSELPLSDHEDGELYYGKQYEPEEALELLVSNSVAPSLQDDLQDNLLQAELYCDYDWASLPPLRQWQLRWKEFNEVIRHRARFFFMDIPDLQEDRNHDEPDPKTFFGAIMVALDRADAFSILPENSTIHRGRPGKPDEVISGFDTLTSPPSEWAATNRFSPAGIPMFYGAENKTTVVEEIAPKAENKVVIGEFITKRPLALIDFTNAQLAEGRFDPDWTSDYHVSDFLEGFLGEIRKPIERDGKEHVEYIPTQIICEFFRFFGSKTLKDINLNHPAPSTHLLLEHFTHNNRIDGICFRSSRPSAGKCYVLFYDAIQSREILKLRDETTIPPNSPPAQKFADMATQ
jgi:hypothetical protein